MRALTDWRRLPYLDPGLPADLLDAADLRVAIPMTGTAESLNLAVAAGVLLYEARRQALRAE